MLSSEMAANYINGVQSQRVAANLKHFVCNNQEYERMTTNAVVDERTLNELYLRVFQLVLEKSDPWTIMGSAVVEILFGLAEPGWRLPETYPCRLEDTPSYPNFPCYPDAVPEKFLPLALYVFLIIYEL